MPAKPRLEGKTAFITGANQGIGAAMARAMAAEGANLFLADLKTDGIGQVAEEARALGVKAEHGVLDVTDETVVEAMLSEAEAKVGAVDILVNCAGVFHAAPILEYQRSDWDRVMTINVTGTLLCCQAALRRMIPRGQGKIVNLASIAGRRGAKFATAYVASKHAVIGITRSLAMETAAQGIRVNAICPGYINTDMYDEVAAGVGALNGVDDPERFREMMVRGTPIHRMVEPEEIALLGVYLASPESDGMTGQAITLSGGLVMQ